MTSLSRSSSLVVGPCDLSKLPFTWEAKPLAALCWTISARGYHTALPEEPPLAFLSYRFREVSGPRRSYSGTPVSCTYIPVFFWLAITNAAITKAQAFVQRLFCLNPSKLPIAYIQAAVLFLESLEAILSPLLRDWPQDPVAGIYTRSWFIQQSDFRMSVKGRSRARSLGDLLLVLACASATCASMQPFQPVETAAPIARRQESCLADFFSCADQGPAFDGTCCRNGQRCALDENNEPACCPIK